MVMANVRVTVYLFELAFDIVIVEYIMHSGILNYTKLAFNSLKMIQNDTVYQPIKQGMIGYGINFFLSRPIGAFASPLA